MDLYCVWLIIFGLTLTSTLRILEWPPLNCTQLDLQCSVQINNCSDEGWIIPRHQAPNGPLWHSGSQQHVFVRRGESGDLLPVMSLSWSLQINGGVINGTSGTEVHVTEEDSNKSICVRYIFHNKIQNMMINWKPWTFSLDRVVVDPENKYSVSIYNLPKPDLGNYRLDKIFTIPGCMDPRIKAAKVCLENGSLWDPQLSWTVSVDGGERLIITVGFNTAEFSDEYQISIQNTQHSQHVMRVGICGQQHSQHVMRVGICGQQHSQHVMRVGICGQKHSQHVLRVGICGQQHSQHVLRVGICGQQHSQHVMRVGICGQQHSQHITRVGICGQQHSQHVTRVGICGQQHSQHVTRVGICGQQHSQHVTRVGICGQQHSQHVTRVGICGQQHSQHVTRVGICGQQHSQHVTRVGICGQQHSMMKHWSLITVFLELITVS
ncbi:interleukin-17 receptor A [Oncorhynchus mykiss]|uniref:interleukin-17 receptor A n=1 Tax=Oncorhynchus mykiss TaxID=8022 RepID=UPI0018788ACF|nr:interleukin-17 receptor A [Oncorhynchus mykiss]